MSLKIKIPKRALSASIHDDDTQVSLLPALPDYARSDDFGQTSSSMQRKSSKRRIVTESEDEDAYSNRSYPDSAYDSSRRHNDNDDEDEDLSAPRSRSKRPRVENRRSVSAEDVDIDAEIEETLDVDVVSEGTSYAADPEPGTSSILY